MSKREVIARERPVLCSVSRGCKVIELPHSTFYYRPAASAQNLDDAHLIELIGAVQDEFPGYGYRRKAGSNR
jgi:hypothetical protein